MYLMSFRADQHHANPKAILIGGAIHIEDPLFCIFLIGCKVLTVSHLNCFRCLGIGRHPSYFGCISVGKLYYKVGKGMPLNCHSGAIAYMNCLNSIANLRSLPEAFGFWSTWSSR